MTNEPLISVIVPVYKVEHYLEKCVRSIQNQTYANLEIILVDDGSPDRSGELCDALAAGDSRIRIIHQGNGGQARARNSGLAAATGDFVGFVDSDDSIDGDMYACLYDAMVKHNADLAVCNARWVAESGAVLKAHPGSGEVCVYHGESAYDRLIPTLNNSVWNKLFRRDLLAGKKFPEGIFHGEDFIFLLEYLKSVHAVAMVNADKYNYLQRKGSVTGSTFSHKKLDEIASKDVICKIIEKSFPAHIAVAKKWCFTARMNVVRGIVRAGNKKEWEKTYQEGRAYLKANFSNVRLLLSCREKAEAWVLCRLPAAYPVLLKLALRVK